MVPDRGMWSAERTQSLLLGGLGYGTGGIHVLRGDKGPATSLGHNPCSATPRHSR